MASSIVGFLWAAKVDNNSSFPLARIITERFLQTTDDIGNQAQSMKYGVELSEFQKYHSNPPNGNNVRRLDES